MNEGKKKVAIDFSGIPNIKTSIADQFMLVQVNDLVVLRSFMIDLVSLQSALERKVEGAMPLSDCSDTYMTVNGLINLHEQVNILVGKLREKGVIKDDVQHVNKE